ncbi:MAG: hypothetical protein JWR52_19 [Marmoricola sp.]|nr:hypothetical protein [Marmoricola sp.]
MKVTTFGRASLGLATAVTLTVTLGVSAANAAGGLTATQEDPSVANIGKYTLVGVGSDTIQDVEYGISQDLGSYTDPTGTFANVASWTATGTTSMSYRSGGTPAVPTAHPNGSGPGYLALRESLGQTAAGADGVAIGDVDYSRASGFQGTAASGQSGVVTEIPFAIDAISFAAPAGSPFLLTNSGAGLKVSDLANIYSGSVNEVSTTTGALQAETVLGTVDAGFLPIQAFVPKPGSGSRQFFLKQLNQVNPAVAYGSDKGDSDFSTAGTPTEGTTPTPYVGAVMPDGTAVQEHDGTVLTTVDKTKAAAIAPFSAAKFIGYHNGVVADPDTGKVAGTDYVLVPFDSTVSAGAVLPYVDNSGTFAPNPAYSTDGHEGTATLTREVFNIVPTAAIINPNASVKYRELFDTFAGPGSKFCLDTKTIQAYGFVADTVANGGAGCGNTTRTADVGSASTPVVSHSAAVAGRSTTVTVTVQSIGNGGGTVKITIAGVQHTGTIAPGATSTSFVIATPHAVTINYGGAGSDGFTPNLAGVLPSPIGAGAFPVAKATPVVRATAARVSHTVAGKVVVTVSATGLTPTGHVTVVIKKGTTTKVTRTVALSGGRATATLIRLPRGTYYVYVSYSGSSDVASKGSTRLTTLTVT